MALAIDLPDLEATFRLGRGLGALLLPGAVVALIGPLGAGKTHLARAIAEGLAIPDPHHRHLVLMQEYPARLTMYHFDAYRLGGVADFDALGAEEQLFGEGVCLIEARRRALSSCRTITCGSRWSRPARTAGANLEATGPRHEVLISGLG